MIKKFTALLMLVALLAISVTGAMASDLSNSLVWDGQGSDSEQCDKLGESPERTEDGWIHWIVTQADNVTEAELVLGGSGSGTYDPTKYGSVIEFFTPYFDVDTLEATLYYEGTLGANSQFVISDYCPGVAEELTVSKTVVTSYDREHFWDIAKKVETENGFEHNDLPKLWLYTDGSGDEMATWTIDVTYEGYEDSGHNVSGTITIENTGGLDAVITSVDDLLAGEAIDVDCGVTFPYTLLVGDTLICDYDVDVDGQIEGFNEVTVTTERDTYAAVPEAIVWGDPTNETNATVNVKDISDLFGEVDLGEVSEPNDAQFIYYNDFAYVDFDECGDFAYNNTATIVETEQEASATLLVNVQCLIFEGQTAWAANGDEPLELRYQARGNWATYVEYDGEKTTTLFAGQTMAVGTVHFSDPVDGEVTITVTLDDGWEFEDVANNLSVQDYDTAPSGNPSPGLFDHQETCDPDESTCSIVVPENNFYGVHVDVGQWVPDPDFGP
jgi:hypothetical protein